MYTCITGEKISTTDGPAPSSSGASQNHGGTRSTRTAADDQRRKLSGSATPPPSVTGSAAEQEKQRRRGGEYRKKGITVYIYKERITGVEEDRGKRTNGKASGIDGKAGKASFAGRLTFRAMPPGQEMDGGRTTRERREASGPDRPPREQTTTGAAEA